MTEPSAVGRVFLFPGQGRLYGAHLKEAIQRPDDRAAAREVFEAVDRCARPFGMSTNDWWDRSGGADPEDTQPLGTPQLVMLAAAVALSRALMSQQAPPDALMGCSFGEIAAFVVAGAWTLADGVQAVCELESVLEKVRGSGGMLLLHDNPDTVHGIIEALGLPRVVISCRTGPYQTVISGPFEELDMTASAARELGVPTTPLPMVRCLSHHPEAAESADRYHARLAGIAQAPFRIPVYSPCAGRWYTAGDDLRRRLADNLRLPLDITGALHTLARQGASCFVECGYGGGLAQAATDTLQTTCVHSPLRLTRHNRK
ncbi:acyltransferase domain-containing protein [Streptomyces sp. NPDC001508]|uniref:ACP S-malonyltransferase n=1 Tax=Streptomyces sp. NPDC001508 TaxID=3154656 RepID=UPI003323EBA1